MTRHKGVSTKLDLIMELILGLPILRPLGPPAIHKLQEDCFADLATTSGERRICVSELGPVRFSFLTAPEDHPLIGPLWKHPGTWRKYHLLTAAVDPQSYIDNLVAEYRSSEEAFVRVNAEHLAIEFAAKDFEMEMRKLLLLANMLRP